MAPLQDLDNVNQEALDMSINGKEVKVDEAVDATGDDNAAIKKATNDPPTDTPINSEADNHKNQLRTVITEVIRSWRGASDVGKTISMAMLEKITLEAVLDAIQDDSNELSTVCDENNKWKAYSELPKELAKANNNKDQKNKSEDLAVTKKTEEKPAENMVPIGEGHAKVPSYLLKKLNWKLYKGATRKILEAVFGRKVLATHNLTGKPSPAFPDKRPKGKLDELLVNDVVQTIMERSGVAENVVRTCITIKCADESKWLRKEQEKEKIKKEAAEKQEMDTNA